MIFEKLQSQKFEKTGQSCITFRNFLSKILHKSWQYVYSIINYDNNYKHDLYVWSFSHCNTIYCIDYIIPKHDFRFIFFPTEKFRRIIVLFGGALYFYISKDLKNLLCHSLTHSRMNKIVGIALVLVSFLPIWGVGYEIRVAVSKANNHKRIPSERKD